MAIGTSCVSHRDEIKQTDFCCTWGLSGLFVLAVANLANEVLVVSPIERHGPVDKGIQQHP